MAKKNNKQKRGLPLSASHLVLYAVLLVYIAVAIVGIYCVVALFNMGCYDYVVQIIIALFSYTAATGGTTIGFYEWKAKSENEAAAANRKYEVRLNLAKEIFEECRRNNLDADAVALLKSLISDNDTSVITSGIGTTIVDETKYNSTNLNNMNDILG